MGLKALSDDKWLQPEPDLTARAAAFDDHPDSLAHLPQAIAAQRELAALLGMDGSLEQLARSHWEDMCILTHEREDHPYRLSAAAVAFPTDWRPAEKLGEPLIGLHKPIHGYAEQLASGVDRFMQTLKPGRIYGRTNWFIAPTGSPRWMASELPDRPFDGVDGTNAGERLFARCERQTLRKLPETGAILFTIGIYTSALADLNEPNLAFLANALATIPAEEAARRGSAAYSASLMAYASERTESSVPQIDQGDRP